jgi:hypothetical protein
MATCLGDGSGFATLNNLQTYYRLSGNSNPASTANTQWYNLHQDGLAGLTADYEIEIIRKVPTTNAGDFHELSEIYWRLRQYADEGKLWNFSVKSAFSQTHLVQNNKAISWNASTYDDEYRNSKYLPNFNNLANPAGDFLPYEDGSAQMTVFDGSNKGSLQISTFATLYHPMNSVGFTFNGNDWEGYSIYPFISYSFDILYIGVRTNGVGLPSNAPIYRTTKSVQIASYAKKTPDSPYDNNTITDITFGDLTLKKRVQTRTYSQADFGGDSVSRTGQWYGSVDNIAETDHKEEPEDGDLNLIFNNY